ncbi:MAG: ParB N-terminal domain-containing protein, partial [Lentisphaerae bacterium]|nr:ParB N-terminal domain-containing protein [Lentisphaerota bacterium]
MAKKKADGNGEFVWRDHSQLEPHPAAIVPIDEEDQRAIGESIAEIGILVPLLITLDDQIIDGVNRWRQAQEQGIDSVPCVIRTEAPEEIVAQCLTARRKCTTGTRILVYVERNRTAVLEASEICKEKGQKFINANNTPNDHDERLAWTYWTGKAIAKRLQ